MIDCHNCSCPRRKIIPKRKAAHINEGDLKVRSLKPQCKAKELKAMIVVFSAANDQTTGGKYSPSQMLVRMRRTTYPQTKVINTSAHEASAIMRPMEKVLRRWISSVCVNAINQSPRFGTPNPGP